MGRLSLLEKLKIAIQRERVEDEEFSEQRIEKFDFYIPQRDTMQQIKNRQPLDAEQINDYINYVMRNYMLSEFNVDKLEDFLAEWTIMTTDMNRATARYQKARHNITECLKNGISPSPLDELWISKEIFIDQTRNGDARVIYKVINDGEIDIQVILEREDLQIGRKIKYLKNELRKTVFHQSVEKTL